MYPFLYFPLILYSEGGPDILKKLKTIWTEAAAQGETLKEYPRPGMKRKHWINLNGMWDYLITDKRILPHQFYENEYFPFDGQILVPFSPEVPLSQVNRQLLPDEVLWYSRVVQLPEGCLDVNSQRLLLHFGAVDQICSVYIGGKFVAYHKGGYLPFTVDITDFIAEDLTVSILISVHDFSDTSYHARGKQQLERGGMFYTAQSGIWQTVWMEIVPDKYIKDIRTTPDYDKKKIRMRVRTASAPDQNAITCRIYPPVFLESEGLTDDLLHEEITSAALLPGKESAIPIPESAQKSWTPEEPWLYPYSLEYGEDRVLGYFALRKCNVQTAADGYPRFFLNDQPYFQNGVLDQGYWPDGLYTAPSDEALIHDICAMKTLGFNMLRKHGKIEADRWYFHCDRMGMLVWQDMPNGGSDYQHWFVTYLATLLNWTRIPVKDVHAHLLSRTDEDGRQEYIYELRDMIKTLYNHPSIVTWIPFNEGWGQFSTKKVTDFIHRLDPSRLVDSASGWFDQDCGDINSLHYYFLGLPIPRSERVLALSEFGGYSLRIPEHSACRNIYGYKNFKNSKELTDGFVGLMKDTIIPSVKKGYSATIYTQLSDIEEETNGLLTYDRKKLKMNPSAVKKWNKLLKNSL
jgi:beta-galactosidase/beta-glucuronidase